MTTYKRREMIIDLLCEKGSVSVNKLSKKFNVSTVTIRNDLRQLEKNGCAFRSYGGAILNKQFAFDRPLQDKGRINYSIKNIIAQKAAELVQDGDHIILDSGSTTTQMVPFLRQTQQLIVMTNALNIAYDMANQSDAEIIIVGGNIRKHSYSISSPAMEPFLKNYRFNKYFLGVDGFDLTAGITTANAAEAHLNRIMCEISQEIIAVTDSSKFDRRSFCMITEITKITTLVTDKNIPEHYLTELKRLGINVIIADQF